MSGAALLALIAGQLALAESVREIHQYGADPDALSNIELLIPLLVGEPSEQNRQSTKSERAPPTRLHEQPFSLDELLGPDAPPAGDEPDAPHKRDLSRGHYPRSVYLGSRESEQRVAEGVALWRACVRVARARAGEARGVLLALCAELLDVAGSSPAPPAPPARCSCGRGAHDARRDFVAFGDNPDMVRYYMNENRKRLAHAHAHAPPPAPWE